MEKNFEVLLNITEWKNTNIENQEKIILMTN